MESLSVIDVCSSLTNCVLFIAVVTLPSLRYCLQKKMFRPWMSVAYPGILLGGGSTNSVEDRGQRERRSGGSCNLVQEISFHIEKFS